MKINEIVLVKPLLEKLAKEKMDSASAVPFAAFARDVLTVIQEFEVKRAGLFEKYGEAQEEGNFKIKEENEKKFKSAITRALNKEVDIEPFDLSGSGISIAPADIINVLPLFK